MTALPRTWTVPDLAAAYVPKPAQAAVRQAVATVPRQATPPPAAEPAYVPNGDTLMADTRRFLRHFALWPSEAALTVATAAVAAMNAKDPDTLDPVWEYAFKILVTAEEFGAGKTWLAKLTASLTPKPMTLIEPTKASFVDLIADHRTIIVTEIDKLFATRGRQVALGAVMNACYEPGNVTTRKRGDTVQEIHLFNHAILDGRNQVFSTQRDDTRALVSRCIVWEAVMAPNGYRRPMWDKTAQAAARDGQARLAAWMAQEVAAGMGATIESLAAVPVDMNPRRITLYEPLFTVCERADRFRAERGQDDGYWTAELAAAVEELESVAPAICTSADTDDFMASLPPDKSVRGELF